MFNIWKQEVKEWSEQELTEKIQLVQQQLQELKNKRTNDAIMINAIHMHQQIRQAAAIAHVDEEISQQSSQA